MYNTQFIEMKRTASKVCHFLRSLVHQNQDLVPLRWVSCFRRGGPVTVRHGLPTEFLEIYMNSIGGGLGDMVTLRTWSRLPCDALQYYSEVADFDNNFFYKCIGRLFIIISHMKCNLWDKRMAVER
jgi:hypothetical protein